MISNIYTVIQQCLLEDSWKFKLQDDNSILLGFIGENSNTQIPIVIRSTEYWVSLTAYMLLGIPNDTLYLLAAAKISEWNFTSKMVKFAFSPEKCLVLALELSATKFSKEQFMEAFDIFCYYIDNAYPNMISLWKENGTK